MGMARSLLSIVAIFAIIGLSAAFFKEAKPHQEVAPNVDSTFTAGFDDGLDNPDVISDMRITPARKCGFCMDEPGRRIARSLAFKVEAAIRRILLSGVVLTT